MKKTNMWHREEVLNDLPQSYRERFQDEKKYLQKNITPNSNVLEIGCGDGRSIVDMLDITQNIVGIDHDDKAIKDASDRFSDYPWIKIVKANWENLPFDSNSYDFVICMTTFANFWDKKFDILNEIKRVCKDNGKIIISVFGENALDERMKLYKKVWAEIISLTWWKVTFNKELWANVSEQFSREELEEIFYNVWLKIEDITKSGIAYLCTVTK